MQLPVAIVFSSDKFSMDEESSTETLQLRNMELELLCSQALHLSCKFGGCPKIRDTILGIPIIRTIVYWGLCWGPLILGNYHVSFLVQTVSRTWES